MGPSLEPVSGTDLILDDMGKTEAPLTSVESASVASSEEIVLIPTPSDDPNDPLN